MEERIRKASELFEKGYNCSQSVTAAFADIYGLHEEQALRISASFGGGIGRMRETCGAACGMFILAGLETGSVVAGDDKVKKHNYDVVQKLATAFKERNGALKCSELLHMQKEMEVASDSGVHHRPDKKKSCAGIIEETASIWLEYLEERKK